jgi:ATP-dependent protease HslVU (ClpYQ) peptidase subunit
MPKTGETGAQREARTTAKAVRVINSPEVIAHSAGEFHDATQLYKKTRAKMQQIRGDSIELYVSKPKEKKVLK